MSEVDDERDRAAQRRRGLRPKGPSIYEVLQTFKLPEIINSSDLHMVEIWKFNPNFLIYIPRSQRG